MTAPLTPPKPPPAARVSSPCTGVCRMDADTGWCLGCARSLDEIAAWSALDDAARHAVWLQLPPRQARLRTLHGALPAPRKP